MHPIKYVSYFPHYAISCADVFARDKPAFRDFR